jgi:hypothetical protein
MGIFAFLRILGKGRPPPDAETQPCDARALRIGSVAEMETKDEWLA